MCGLVGMAGNLTRDTLVGFRNLLLLDQVRGWDSTGVGRVLSHVSHMTVEKELGTPEKLFKKSYWFDGKGVMNAIPRVIIGHNRAATLGVVNKDNAHPFTFGHITGAHNGTLRDWQDLEGYIDHDVDSMSLFKTIEIKGVKHAWENFVGSAALTWWDDKEETLNLVRNSERPLHVGWLTNDAIVWASEKWMLEAAFKGTPITFKTNEKGEEDIILLKEHSLHVFKPTGTSCPLTEVVKLTPKKEVVVGRMGYQIWNGSGWKPKVIHGGIKGKPKSKEPFNFHWGDGLYKSDKSMVGKEIVLTDTFTYRQTSSGRDFHFIRGYISGTKDLIQVATSSFEDWQLLSSAIKNQKFSKNIYRIKNRPREYKSQLSGPPLFYRIGWESLELVHGLNPFFKEEEKKDEEVYHLSDGTTSFDRERAEKDLRIAGNECGICGESLTVHDNYQFYHQGAVVICEECSLNKGSLSWLFGNETYGGVQ